jgi:amino acid transporter
MAMRAEPSAQDFHNLAKDAGNKLRAYVLSYSSAATGVFFLALTGRDIMIFTPPQKTLLLAALLFYVATAVLCLLELRVDARRFFHIATQLEEGGGWAENQAYRNLRLALIYGSYVTAILATIAMLAFLVSRIA